MFSQDGIFAKFPYLLPNLVCSAAVVFGLIVGILFLEETHEDKRGRYDPGLKLGNRFLKLFSRADTSHFSSSEESEAFLTQGEKEALFNDGKLAPDSTFERYGESEPAHHRIKRFNWRETFNNQVLLIVLSYGLLAL